MAFWDRVRDRMPRQKSEEELKEHYEGIELERGDLLAMLIAALITFGPLVMAISFIYIAVASLFGL